MDKKYFDALISEMQVLLDGQKFVLEGDTYKNEQKAVKIEYNEEIKQFQLLIADVADGEAGEFAVASSWLFDEGQNERDAAAVGVDFADTLREKLGVKKAKTVASVELPVADKSESASIAALTQKLLAVFPQFKDTYKASVQKYNKFLYLGWIAVIQILINKAVDIGVDRFVCLCCTFLNDCLFALGNTHINDIHFFGQPFVTSAALCFSGSHMIASL